MTGSPKCRYCLKRHRPRWLCDPVKRVIDALYARGMELNMPTLTFPEPIPLRDQSALAGIDAVAAQLVVMGATVTIADTAWPALMFTGQTPEGEKLPRWLHPGDEESLRRVSALVNDMVEQAILMAAKARGEAPP